MKRRVVLFAAIASLMLSVSAVSASAATPVNASGTLHCAMAGTLKFKPALVTGGTATSSALSGKLKSTSCTGTSHVTAISGTFAMALPSNNCTALNTPAGLPAATIAPAKLKGAAKYNPASIHFTAGGHVTVADPPLLDEPGAGTSSSTGSFAGQHPTLHIIVDTTLAALAAGCGGKGLKKLPLKTGSYIDIPA